MWRPAKVVWWEQGWKEAIDPFFYISIVDNLDDRHANTERHKKYIDQIQEATTEMWSNYLLIVAK